MSLAAKLIQKVEHAYVLYIFTFLFLITFIAYANTLGNGLFFDDEDFIYKNVYVQEFAIDKFFTQNLIAGASKISNYYRPLLLITYGLEHMVFGNTAFIYHFTNMILHGFCGIFLFILLKKLLNNTIVPFLTSALFLIHPIQTEAVSYASGRSDSLTTVFMFLTIIFFLKKTVSSKIISYFFFLCALLSRETAIVTPALLIAIDLFQTKSFTKTVKHIQSFVPIILVASMYFFLRLTVLNFQNTLNFYNYNNPYSSNIVNRLLTFFSILPTYIGLIFFPKDLYMERTAQVVRSLLNVSVICSFFLSLFTFFLSLRLFKQYPILLFCFLWFFITIAPASGIIPINGIIYEHFLYLPSIAIFLLISSILVLLLKKTKFSLLSIFIIIITIITFITLIFRTIARNSDWHDPIRFYNQLISYNPKSARVHNNLAMAYADEGTNNKAVIEYKKAIALGDVYPETHFNLGNTFVSLNKLEEAEKEYKRAIDMNPQFFRSYINLAKLYKATNQSKKLDELLRKVEIVSQKNPSFSELIEYIKSL